MNNQTMNPHNRVFVMLVCINDDMKEWGNSKIFILLGRTQTYLNLNLENWSRAVICPYRCQDDFLIF
jgi:ureidoglycolate hydrolase